MLPSRLSSTWSPSSFGVPAALTEDLVSELYGIEALGVQAASTPHDGPLGVVLPFAKVALAH